jgi:hypothetical protein
LEAIQLFTRDYVGLALPNVPGAIDLSRFFPPNQGVNAGEFLTGPFFFPNIFARRIALLELEGFRRTEHPPLSVKELLTRLLYHGWSVQAAPQLVVSPIARNYASENARMESGRDQIAREIILSLKRDFETEPFAETRAGAADPRPLFKALP